MEMAVRCDRHSLETQGKQESVCDATFLRLEAYATFVEFSNGGCRCRFVDRLERRVGDSSDCRFHRKDSVARQLAIAIVVRGEGWRGTGVGRGIRREQVAPHGIAEHGGGSPGGG